MTTMTSTGAYGDAIARLRSRAQQAAGQPRHPVPELGVSRLPLALHQAYLVSRPGGAVHDLRQAGVCRHYRSVALRREPACRAWRSGDARMSLMQIRIIRQNPRSHLSLREA